MKDNTKKKQSKFQSKKFVLMIGDDGAVLNLIINKKLETRLFSTISSQDSLGKFRELLLSYKQASISIVVDTVDQTYLQYSFPAVNSFSIGKLLSRRLNREFSTSDFKSSIFINRSKSSKGEWNYILIACPLAPPLTEWLNFLAEQHNPIKSINLLPVEITRLVNKLNHIFIPVVKPDKKAPKPQEAKPIGYKWQLFICHNKVSGFRQVALRDEKIMFTRLINSSSSESVDVIAGSIEQEVLNTYEYLRRLGFKENDTLDIYILTSAELKASLSTIKFQGRSVTLLTPHETALKLNMKEACAEDDRYSDGLISAFLSTTKPIISFTTPFIKKLAFLTTLNKLVYVPIGLIIPSIIAYAVLFQLNTASIRKEISNLTFKRTNLSEKLQRTQKAFPNLEEQKKITGMVNLYKLIVGEQTSPLPIIADLMKLTRENITIKSLDWKVVEDSAAKSNTPQPALPTDNKMIPIKTVINIEFYNNTNNYQNLFSDFDSFIKDLETIFNNYNIEYSRLADRISFNDTAKVIPVQITITGPKKVGPA